MKKKLRLVTVLKIKEHLETLIDKLYGSIINNNETERSVDSLFNDLICAHDQLIIIKEAVQKANQGRHKTGKSNNYYIYKYSNLQALKGFYFKVKNKATAECQVTPDDAMLKIRKINADLDTISSKLSNFNLRKRVQVVLDDKLELDLVLLEQL